jgi:hypothetical protein
MKKSKNLSNGIGFVLCGGLAAVLVGCDTYVDQPRPYGGYVPAPPIRSEVYVAPPPVQVEASFNSVGLVIRTENDFYEPLSPYGRWEVVGSYGRCWIPNRVDAAWRPYSNGNWERTEAGWYWASDEPWAWATYHYGRWDFNPRFGWYWMPQTQWAPAWVSWHEGGGYVGWAPLQPSARLLAGGSVSLNVALIAPRAFVFVEPQRFLQPVRPATIVVNNTTIINKTVNITNIKIVNNTVINEGPRTQVIEQASGQRIQAVPVRELRRKQEADVVARHQISAPASRPMPAASPVNPAQMNRAGETQRRSADAEARARAQSQREAKDAERATQLESQRRTQEAAARLQEERQRNARASEIKAQQESDQRAKDAERAAQTESQRRAREAAAREQEQSQRNARASEVKAQQESERRAQDAGIKAREESQGSARGLGRKGQETSAPRGKKPVANEKGGAKLLKKPIENDGKDHPTPHDEPPVAPQ